MRNSSALLRPRGGKPPLQYGLRSRRRPGWSLPVAPAPEPRAKGLAPRRSLLAGPEAADDVLDQVPGSVVLPVPDDRDPAPIRACRVALGNGVQGVVGPLAMDVGLEAQEARHDVGLVEDEDMVDAAERRDDLGALEMREDRASLALEPARRRIRVDPHDEDLGLV